MAGWTCSSCGGENPKGMRFCGHCGAAAETAALEAAAADAAADVSNTLRSFVAQPVAERLVEAGGDLPEERRLITALFADVSGFTSLADRLDPEELLEVIDPVISGLSSVVGRYEGYVEKFAGDALLALFGAPVSHEDDAERALLAALEMHRDLARLCQELPYDAELTLHCGVNSGHGIARILGSEARMDYAVLGDSVILAQRLESAAPKGETYVSELTHRLTSHRFEFAPVGELELKGKSEPVPAWRLLRELPRSAWAHAKRSLIGRERELDEISTALEAAPDVETAPVLLLTGEPGVGKSRLTEAARERAEAGGALWLQTRCLSYGASLPYWPYAELLRMTAGVDPQLSAKEARVALTRAVAFGPALPYFARLLGVHAEDSDGEVAALEPDAFRRGLHEAFASWLESVPAERVVLAMEDLHWADPSSLELTAELTRHASKGHVAIYVTGRPEAEQMLSELALDAHILRLEPLGREGVAELVREALGGEPPPELVPWVHERTTGNPFFVGELVRALRDRHTLVAEGGVWKLASGWSQDDIPPTVEGLLASRIDLLPRPAADLLQAASVIGRVVRVPLLAAVRQELDPARELEMLLARGFLDRVPNEGEETLSFHHALVQEVAYSRLLRRQRRDLHLRLAETAEAMYGSGDDVIELLARHLYLGEAGAKAIDYLVRAGERAQALYANEEAILHFERAVELGPENADVRLQLADLYELVGHYEDALRAYGDVREIRPAEVAAWAGIASTLRKRGAYAEALAVIEEALGSRTLSADLGPIQLEQGWTLSVAGRFAEAIDALEAGLESADRTSSVAGHMLLQLARAEMVEERLAQALTHAREAEGIFSELDDARSLATTMRLLGDLHRNRGELDDARRVLRQGLELALATGTVEETGGCLINLGLVELDRGDLTESIECTRRAVAEFERIGHAAGMALGYGNLAYALSRSGAYGEAMAYAERALKLAESIGNALAVADVHDTIAEIRLGEGRFADAAVEAEDAAERFLAMGARTMATKSLRLAAEAWARAGETERARSSEERARSVVPAS